MDRLALEQSDLYDESPAAASRLPGSRRETVGQRTVDSAEHVDPTEPLQQEGHHAPHARSVADAAIPPSFYTATSLYRSDLPTATTTAATVPMSAHPNNETLHKERDRLSPLPSRAPPPPPENAGYVESSPRQRRCVPSPTTQDVLAESAAGGLASRRYPTPPWWRRQYDIADPAAGEDEAMKRGSTVQRSIDGRDRVHTLSFGAPSPPLSPPPPPPPSRSYTRSAVALGCSRTTSPSLTHPPSANDSARSEEGLCGHVPQIPAAAVGDDSKKQLRQQQRQQRQQRHHPHRRRDADKEDYGDDDDGFLSRDGSAASTLPTTAVVHASTQRLHIYEESAAHPSGFAVPRRALGEAAPRTLYNGLALLSSAVADRSAVARAATDGHASVIYGTSNHPSVYSVMKYRQGVAAVTGVDPARLRDGAWRQRYTRVHSGWTEEGAAGAQLAHTTTRLRLGLTGGGAPRALELQDPVSGQSRKPNEVSAQYLMKATRGTRSGRAADTGEKTGSAFGGQRGASRCRVTSTHNSCSCGSSTGQREGQCSLLQERRRRRASARASLLRATHASTGVSMPAEDRRLYWAEHAPLHYGVVRGLNALLQGVGEAEPDDASISDVCDTASANTWAGGDAQDAMRHGEWRRRENRPAPGSHSFAYSASDDARVVPARRDTSYRTSIPTTVSWRHPSWSDGMDGARMQLQDALRRRRGHESTLNASSIPPAAYRHSLSPARGETDAWSDTADYESNVYDEAGASFEGTRRERDAARRGARTMGLVDSYALHNTTSDASLQDIDATRRRDHHSKGGTPMPPSPFSVYHTSPRRTQTVPEAIAQGTHEKESRKRVPPHSLFLFPPMMTPLLQEVDECLRFHGLPEVQDIWHCAVADQTALLRSAGFSAAECRTIVWELERMVRVTSTTCTVAV